MPVLLDRGPSGHVLLGAQPGNGSPDFSPSRCIELALINNMPDAALKATEAQFVELLARATPDMLVRVSLFSLPGVPRAEPGRHYLGEAYSAIGGLWDRPFDALIVTGTEPRAADLSDEPYWRILTQVVDWAEHNTVSTIWSCLAAHAAVLHCDGIGRQRLAEKRSGVFEFSAMADHPIMVGLPPRFPVPHSRYNDLREEELTSCGYVVLLKSAEAGVDTFVNRTGSTFVFFQGHPEYDAGTLFREYRRDVARFLRQERDAYPAMPEGYFAGAMKDRLIAFRARALAAPSEDLLGGFPAVEQDAANTWSASATRFYRNWLASILAEKARRAKPTPSVSSRRSAPRPHGIGNLVAVEGYGIAPSVPAAMSSAPVRQRAPKAATATTPAGRPKA